MELKTTLLNAFVIVNGCSIKEQVAFLVNDNRNAVLLGFVVFCLIVVSGDVQSIIESRASATGN